MDKNKYIEVIDRFESLYTKGAIDRKTAWWATQGVILCAVKDVRISYDDYCYILGYRDTYFG